MSGTKARRSGSARPVAEREPRGDGGAGKRIGYLRVGPAEGNRAAQRTALEQAGCTEIFEDRPNARASDAKPELEAALSSLQPGDTLIVWRLDRLGHSLPQLVETVKELAERGIGFRSLSEDLDTGSPGGQLVYQVMTALVACERALISERTRAGMQAAQEKGRLLGRRPALDEAQKREVVAAILQRGEPLDEVAQRYKVHSRTIRRILNRASGEDAAAPRRPEEPKRPGRASQSRAPRRGAG